MCLLSEKEKDFKNSARGGCGPPPPGSARVKLLTDVVHNTNNKYRQNLYSVRQSNMERHTLVSKHYQILTFLSKMGEPNQTRKVHTWTGSDRFRNCMHAEIGR